MGHISELESSLNGYFSWNKARIACFVKMLLGLFITRTINLNKLACVFVSDAEQLSHYRRLQRFFAKFKIDYDMIDIDALFYGLKPQEQRIIEGKRKIMGDLRLVYFDMG